jgi:hypothetical protein
VHDRAREEERDPERESGNRPDEPPCDRPETAGSEEKLRERGGRREEQEGGEVEVEERDRSGGEKGRPGGTRRFRFLDREAERPEEDGQRRDVVEEADEERLRPEQRNREERQPGIDSQGAEEGSQRVGKAAAQIESRTRFARSAVPKETRAGAGQVEAGTGSGRARG